MSFYTPHSRVSFETTGVSRTKQSFKDECDINRILKKYEKTGLLSHVSKYGGRYEDLPSDVDYQTSLNVIMEAEQAFSSLPSKIRARFENSPEYFLNFVSDPKNENEVADLGLTKSTRGVQGQAPAPSQSEPKAKEAEAAEPPPAKQK